MFSKFLIYLFFFLCSEALFAQGKKLSSQQEYNIQNYKLLVNKHEKLNNKVEVAEYLNKIAYIYWESEHHTEALEYFTQSMEINKTLNNKNALKSIYNSLGMIYSDLGQYDMALNMFSENLKICRKLKQNTDIISGLINLSVAYEDLKKNKEAITCLDEALKIAQEENNIKLMRRCYSALAENYENLGNGDKSMEYINLYLSLDKILQKEENELKDQKINQLQSISQDIKSTLSTKAKRLEETEASLKEVQQLTREKQMEIDLLQRDNLIQSLKIRQQEAQIKFERQLLEIQTELQSAQDKKLIFERSLRQILMGGVIIISLLALVIYMLYRQIKEKDKKLLESKDHLEELVRIRTADLEQAKIKAEESDKLKTVFLSNVSHEIKTPLNAIIGISKMMLKNYSESLDEKNKESLKFIHESGHRLFRLLDDILIYSEILAGNAAITISDIQTESLKRQIHLIAKDSIGDKPIFFSINVDSDFPESFKSDSNKLLQIISNLLENASKFTDNGTINISLKKGNNIAIFYVTDTGKGIDKADITKIFLGFKQLDDSASRKQGGTGLGLAICKGFIDLLGGSISVESEINEGTCFHFEIPV
jgi:two-component system, sensor histidine kinase and response regulator